MANLHFLLGIMSFSDFMNSLNNINNIKRLFIHYGVPNVTDAFLFDVSIYRGINCITVFDCDIVMASRVSFTCLCTLIAW